MTSRWARLVVVPALLLLGASCAVTERKTVTIQREWAADQIRKLDLEEVNGSVEVDAGDPGKITLEARVRYFGVTPSQEENQGFFETTITGDSLRIGRRRHGGQFRLPFIGGREVTIDYTLRVPADTELDIETINGEIDVAGTSARAALESVNGAIKVVATGTSPLDAHTVNGEVSARFVKDFIGAKVRTVNGGVQVTLPAESSFTCELAQVNGGFESNFPLSIRSSKGNRAVSGVVNGGRHPLTIKTVNGEIDLIREGTPATENEDLQLEPAEPVEPPEPIEPPEPVAPPTPPAN